jgi:hypothetical protein
MPALRVIVHNGFAKVPQNRQEQEEDDVDNPSAIPFISVSRNKDANRAGNKDDRVTLRASAAWLWAIERQTEEERSDNAQCEGDEI